jgi:hypothetical protein
MNKAKAIYRNMNGFFVFVTIGNIFLHIGRQKKV